MASPEPVPASPDSVPASPRSQPEPASSEQRPPLPNEVRKKLLHSAAASRSARPAHRRPRRRSRSR